jgi:hypothetical protein
LVGLFCVVFFGELGNLPGAPAFVAEGPVFYLKWQSVDVIRRVGVT